MKFPTVPVIFASGFFVDFVWWSGLVLERALVVDTRAIAS